MISRLLLLFLLECVAAAPAPLAPRQLVLPGAGGTTSYWLPAAAASTAISSTYASSVLPSSSSPASSSSFSSSLPSSPLLPSTTAALEKPFNVLYLIPLFAVIGLSILFALGWLIHGCCTRKPKSRPQPPLLPQHTSFKALRYEDQPLHTQTDDRPCQHVKEYGFQCDCGKHTEKEKEAEEDGYIDIPFKVEDINDTPGFRIVDDDLISSSSPLSQLSTRLKLDSSSTPLSSSSSPNGSWLGKVVYAFGSRFSLASAKEEDRYTAIPGPSPRQRNNLVKKKDKRKEKRSSNHVRLSSDPLSTTPPTTTTKEQEEDIIISLSQKQKRRLQNHRDSIASLPAGMVFSPPAVGFAVFGMDDGFGAAAAGGVAGARDRVSLGRL